MRDWLMARRARMIVLGALLATLVLASTAVAATGTSLQTATRTVKGKRQTIVVTGAGRTVYALGGESRAKLHCISATCLKTWKPVTVSSATAKVTVAGGVPGRVSILTRTSAK